ncbi:MAG: hypothetical protein GX906_05955 [Clostridiales bacterium]|nr:hypothetical protein [Clostridiales bacterium]
MESKNHIKSIATICILGIFLVILIALSIFRLDVFAAMGDYLIINDGTPMYQSANDTQAIEWLNKGDILSEVEVLDGYYKAKVNGTEGYIRKYDVEIVSVEDISTSFFTAKAFSIKVGERVKLYEEASYDARIVHEIKDGRKLVVSDQNNDGFYAVKYNNEILYVPTSNITRSLSTNQRAALLATMVASATIILIFVLLYIYKHIKNKKMLEEFESRRWGQ